MTEIGPLQEDEIESGRAWMLMGVLLGGVVALCVLSLLLLHERLNDTVLRLCGCGPAPLLISAALAAEQC